MASAPCVRRGRHLLAPDAGRRPVAILAGSGELPILLATKLEAMQHSVRIVAFQGFADRAVRARADLVVGLLDVRRIKACLEAWQPAFVTLGGGLTRPSPAALIGAYSAFRDREELAALATRGDDNLLRGAVRFIEDLGYPVVGVREVAPELLAPVGLHGRHEPARSDEVSFATGFALLDAVSSFDVGQAAIVVGERVLALEGPEGTDRMLARARGHGWRRLFGREARGGVLVKGPKRGQDLRVDLPAIGPRTVANAARAGLAGIAITSGLTLVIDRAKTVAAADRQGLFLIGVDRGVPDQEASHG